MAKAPASIAATSTLAMLRTAEARAVPTLDLLEEVGLTRECLEDPDARLPAPTVLAIWEKLRERSGDPDLQLVAPTSLPFGAYRVIDYLVGASATVGEGIQRFVRFFRLIADAVTLNVDTDDDGYCLCLATAAGGPVPPVYVDYVFAALVSRIRMHIRPNLQVLGVELRRPEPQMPSKYGDVFCAPIHFGAAADQLCFSYEEWNAPMDTADATLASLLEEHARILARRAPNIASGFRAEVLNAVASTLPEGGSAADVARVLHVSIRTLQRKLVADGTSFKELCDQARSQLAEEYMADPKVSIAEVAFLLGFSGQSSFNRAFRRWTGDSPGRWRRQQGMSSRLIA